ncbi:MAG: MBL fold metallo-hydrolase [Lachnospiraceae bacterium]|nr:MBL fold metallo-hydrolase [Lachnospiraceae bacterium]
MKKGYMRIVNIILTAAIFISGIFAPASTSSAVEINQMEVHFIDVGQGDSTLIICGEHAMLIDTGDEFKGTAIQNYLQKRNIEKLDYLILTHPDADHIGGAPVIITKFEIDNVFVSNYHKDTAAYQKLIQALDYKGLKYSTPEVGSQYFLGTAVITVLAPNKEYDNPNDSSIALIVRNGNNKFLFTGDAGEEAEYDIINNGMDISADVYHVGHHGSKTSSSRDLIRAVSPTYAVISCAEGNYYGLPNAETLNSLRVLGVKVFRTDEQGSIIAVSDGNKIIWNCSPSRTWQVGEPNRSSANDIYAKSAEKTYVIDDSVNSTSEITYVCNTNTGKFHDPGCSSVDQMSEKNKLVSDAAREELIGQGYVPCKVCNP